jgi:hypothetical protein
LLAEGGERNVNLYPRLAAMRAHCTQANDLPDRFARCVSAYRAILHDAVRRDRSTSGRELSLPQQSAIRLAEVDLDACIGADVDDSICRALDLFLAPSPAARDDEWFSEANISLSRVAVLLGEENASEIIADRLRRLLIASGTRIDAPDTRQRAALEKRVRKMLGEPASANAP